MADYTETIASTLGIMGILEVKSYAARLDRSCAVGMWTVKSTAMAIFSEDVARIHPSFIE